MVVCWKAKKTLGDRAFQAAAPFLWNKLLRSARVATNLESFKTLIKTYPFNVNIVFILTERFVKFYLLITVVMRF